MEKCFFCCWASQIDARHLFRPHVTQWNEEGEMKNSGFVLPFLNLFSHADSKTAAHILKTFL